MTSGPGQPAVRLAARRCLRRGAPGACSRCLRVCPRQAIAPDTLTLAERDCSGCGLCVAACPTGAWESPALRAQVAFEALQAPLAGCVVFRCEGATASASITETVVRLPCAAAVTPVLLLEAAARGAERVVVEIGACPACRGKIPLGLVSRNVAIAGLLMPADSSGRGAFEVRSSENLPTTSRRELLGGWLTTREPRAQTNAPARRRFARAMPADCGWRVDLPRVLHERPPSRAGLRRPGWLPLGRVSIQPERCDQCAACARVCPTGAWRVRESAESVGLERVRALCVGCASCVRVCQPEALRMEGEVHLADLALSVPEEVARGSRAPCRRCDKGRGIRQGYCPSCYSRARLAMEI